MKKRYGKIYIIKIKYWLYKKGEALNFDSENKNDKKKKKKKKKKKTSKYFENILKTTFSLNR